MDFKEITLDDRELLNPYLLENPYGICDYSFANIYIWRKVYNTTYCIHNNRLILRAETGGIPSYLMPLGKGGSFGKNDKKDALCQMMEHAKIAGEGFRLSSVTPQMEEELNSILPKGVTISNPTDNCDYVYLSENMRELKGKKFNGKRNHINKFMSLYGDRYRYEEVNASNLHMCREMNHLWCKEKGCDKEDGEFCATMYAIDNYEALGLEGGAIFVDGEMIAFSLGQPNNSQTYNIIIEKALSHIEGAYPMINREFARNNCQNHQLINREEDLGILGLKKAKLSYYPHIILKKGMGIINE